MPAALRHARASWLLASLTSTLVFLLIGGCAQSLRARGPSLHAQHDTTRRREVVFPATPPREQFVALPAGIAPHPVITRNLTLLTYRADSTITGTTANTRISLEFRNDTGRRLEGSFLFPVPTGAIVTDFALRDGDKVLEPELLEAGTARAWYEEIVRKAIDPGLIEYINQSTYRISAFPFEPNQERAIELSFTHTLPTTGEAHVFHLPIEFALPNINLIQNLRSESQSGWADLSRPAQLVCTVAIANPAGLGAISSPTHPVSVSRVGNREAHVSMEASLASGTEDFELQIERLRDDMALSAQLYPGAGGEDGYFTATIYPAWPKDFKAVPKDVVLVIDRSSSMLGEKWTQTQAAMQHVVSNLDAKDRLGLVVYDSAVEVPSKTLQPLTATNRAWAQDYLRGLGPAGSTALADALTATADLLKDNIEATRPAYVLFFTDGLPTVGERDPGAILAGIKRAMPKAARLFTFGVGTDVNATLLDNLALEHHGVAEYVEPGESVTVEVTRFYDRMRYPALTDLAIDWPRNFDAYHVQPAELPDLFYGSELLVSGRYRGKAPSSLALNVSGQREGKRGKVELEAASAPDLAYRHVPRVWANMRVARLMGEARLHGENAELTDEITALAQRYGIVTPYTSYLVREDDPNSLMARTISPGGSFAAGTNLDTFRDSASMSVARKGWTVAPDTARDVFMYRGDSGGGQQFAADAIEPDAAWAGDAPSRVLRAGSLTFYAEEGAAIDSRYKPDAKAQIVQIAAYSERYFALLASVPELAEVFALATEVTLRVSDDLVLQIVLVDETGQPAPASAASGYSAASDKDWQALGEALARDTWRG